MNAYEILKDNERFAIVGMRPDPDTYAHKIYRLLKEKGKTVYGLNPKYDEIDGDKIYDDLSDLNKEVDVVVFLVNPKIGVHMLEDMQQHQIPYLWMQPGSVDETFKKEASKRNLNVIEACVLAVYAIHE